MSDPNVVASLDQAPEHPGGDAPFHHTYRVLTPSMRERGGRLGVVHNRLPPGNVACPFHWHAREDEAFYVLSGRGVLRYGDTLTEIGPGDCVSCPAGTQIAHQIGNPFDEDLVYLAIGDHDPDEVCVYPDNGKIFARAAGRIGHLSDAPYMDGEPQAPVLLARWRQSHP